MLFFRMISTMTGFWSIFKGIIVAVMRISFVKGSVGILDLNEWSWRLCQLNLIGWGLTDGEFWNFLLRFQITPAILVVVE